MRNKLVFGICVASALFAYSANAETQYYSNVQYAAPATATATARSNYSASPNANPQPEQSATPSPTAAPSNTLSQPSTSAEPPSSLNIARIFGTITYPNGGETITLAKGKAISYVKFTYGGALDETSGNYSYRLELWRYGKLLGNIIGGLERLPLNPYKDSVSYGDTPGRYYAKNSKGYLEAKIAEAGGGYTFKVVLMEAYTPKGEATTYRELTSDFSDAPFSYAADTSPHLLGKIEPISATVIYPENGEAISLSEKIAYVKFKYAGTFSEEKGGNYEYRLELWQNGKLLGSISNLDYFPLNPYQTSVNYGGAPGEYWMPNPKTGLDHQIAAPGTGYKYKVTLFEAYTPPGEPTKHKELASDFSNDPFSFTSGALTKFTVRVSTADVVKSVEVRGWDPKKREEIIAQAPKLGAVKTTKDLQAFAEGVAAADANIETVSASDKEVEVDYQYPAKLLGFIPIHYTVAATVDENGRVKVKFPWLTIFTAGDNFGKISDEIQQDKEVGKMTDASELKNKLDSLSEMSEMTSLRLQMLMDRRSKFIATLSTIMKKISDTQDTLVQNLK